MNVWYAIGSVCMMHLMFPTSYLYSRIKSFHALHEDMRKYFGVGDHSVIIFPSFLLSFLTFFVTTSNENYRDNIRIWYSYSVSFYIHQSIHSIFILYLIQTPIFSLIRFSSLSEPSLPFPISFRIKNTSSAFSLQNMHLKRLPPIITSLFITAICRFSYHTNAVYSR